MASACRQHHHLPPLKDGGFAGFGIADGQFSEEKEIVRDTAWQVLYSRGERVFVMSINPAHLSGYLYFNDNNVLLQQEHANLTAFHYGQ